MSAMAGNWGGGMAPNTGGMNDSAMEPLIGVTTPNGGINDAVMYTMGAGGQPVSPGGKPCGCHGRNKTVSLVDLLLLAGLICGVVVLFKMARS